MLSLASASIVTVDPNDAASVQATHAGTDLLELIDDGGGSAMLAVAGDGSPGIGANGNFSIMFSQGESLAIVFGFDSFLYQIQGAFNGGAGAGFTYARLDLDGDFAFETVLEFYLGHDTEYAGDVITRYAYDDTGAALDVPEALAALGEPTVPIVPTVEMKEISVESGGKISVKWTSNLPAGTEFVLKSSVDPSLPFDQWNPVSSNLQSGGPGVVNSYTSAEGVASGAKLFLVIERTVQVVP